MNVKPDFRYSLNTMALGKECKFAGDSSCRPFIDMSTKATIWRLANLGMTVFFALYGVAQWNAYDWWLWTPIYAIPSLLCFTVAVCPKVVDHPLWRALCASVIVFGLVYLLYVFWIVHEVVTSYLQDPVNFEEGRKIAGLAVAIVWSVICRLTAKTTSGILVHVRLLTLVAILLCCLAVFAWSVCFFSTGQQMLPYCWIMFATGDKDV